MMTLGALLLVGLLGFLAIWLTGRPENRRDRGETDRCGAVDGRFSGVFLLKPQSHWYMYGIMVFAEW